MIKQFHHLFKTVIIGDSGVGKSSILIRFAENQFVDNYLATIGVDFRFKTMTVDQKNVKFQIWDTAGQQRFRTITSAYYRGSQAVLLVFDITDHQSFKDLAQFWMSEVQTYAEKDALLIMIGNKSDLVSQRQVTIEEAQKYCQSKSITYIQCSAKQDEKVTQIFQTIAKKLMERLQSKNNSSNTIKTKELKQEKPKKKGCC